jgi:hypothetical protein
MFTDSQLKTLFAVVENGNAYRVSTLAKTMGKALPNFLPDIVQPLVKNKSLYYGISQTTKRRGRPSAIVHVTSNRWILRDIYLAMEIKAAHYERIAQKYDDICQKCENIKQKCEDMRQKYPIEFYKNQLPNRDDYERWREASAREREALKKGHRYFFKYIEWDERAMLFLCLCKKQGLRFPSREDCSPDNAEWNEHYDILNGITIECGRTELK